MTQKAEGRAQALSTVTIRGRSTDGGSSLAARQSTQFEVRRSSFQLPDHRSLYHEPRARGLVPPFCEGRLEIRRGGRRGNRGSDAARRRNIRPGKWLLQGQDQNFWFLEPGDRMGARRTNGVVDAVIEKPFSFSGADEVVARRHSFFSNQSPPQSTFVAKASLREAILRPAIPGMRS